jgi:hypothetical protein
VDARRGRFDDIVGRTWCCLTTDSTPLPADAASALVRLGAHDGACVARIVDGRSATSGSNDVVDVDGTYEEWFESIGCAWVLVRPDAYVFGTAGDAAGAARLLADAAARLA